LIGINASAKLGCIAVHILERGMFFGGEWRDARLQPSTPVTGLPVLVSNGVDLRAGMFVWFVDDCVREAVQVIDAKTIFAMRTALLILDQQISHALELCEERLSYGETCTLGVVDRGVAKLGFGVRV